MAMETKSFAVNKGYLQWGFLIWISISKNRLALNDRSKRQA